MPAAWVAAGGALLGAMGGGSSSGGQQTVSKDPWAPAQPWLTSLLGQGQNLQSYYQNNPFNSIQQGAYQNLLSGNDYINQMMPGLLSQMSQPVGFDRSNPHAKPQAYQFPAMQQMPQMAGLLNNPSAPVSMNRTQNPYANGLMPTAPAAAPAASAPGVAAPFDIRTQQGMLDWANSMGGSV